MRSVLRLAWPAILSFTLGNAYRINDQYWVKGLGPDAQAAIASCIFALILNFSVIFLAVGGTLPLVARAAGARDDAERDEVIRHGLKLGALIALFLMIVGTLATPHFGALFDVAGKPAEMMADYLLIIYLGMLPLVISPVVNNVFIAMGNTRVPMALQAIAVMSNLVLNPLLIYGLGDWDGMGIAGAALATFASRALSASLGLVILKRLYSVQLIRGGHFRARRLLEMAKLGSPVAASIGFYSAVYIAMFRYVIADLGTEVAAGFGIGFNAFESVSYPFYLGVALAGSSLVGRNLGAKDPTQAMLAVRNVQRVGRVMGVAFALLFLVCGPLLTPLFSEDPAVVSEALLYVSILAFSQPFVAEEAVGEKVLYGAGHPRPVFWISTPANLLRVPLAWFLAIQQGYGAAGVWWTINITTYIKAACFYVAVRRGRWLDALQAPDALDASEAPSRGHDEEHRDS